MTEHPEPLAWLLDRLDAADEAGEFGECCRDSDCRACNILVAVHDIARDAPSASDLRAENERLRAALTEVHALLNEYAYAATRLLDKVGEGLK